MKSKHTMKKILLILSIFVVTFSSAFAADLNPFAYGLRSSVNASNPMQLDIQFSINAPATSVKVYLYEIDGDWEVEVDAHLTVDNRAYKGWIDLSVVPGDLRGGTKNLNWRVDVNKGSARTTIELASNEVKLDFPSSVDIDNNPENENFGTVFVVEALPTGKGNSKFISKNEGAGLYILNADGTARPVPNRDGQYGYNGGRVKQDRQYFNGNSSSGFSPYRVRVSDDGRIFISSMTTDGEVLWEADPLVFSRPDAPDWETRAVAGWSHVMSDLNTNTVLGTARRNCSHTYCGIYHLYQGSASGPFIAGPNMGFDVRGSGKDLKLLMLAGCKEAIVNFQSAHFYCDEYELGEAKMWNTPPSRRIFSGYVVNYAGVQVQYDGDGNVWLCQHRSGTDAETLMKFDVNNLEADPWKEIPKKTYHRCGAIRFNNDYTQVAIATIGSGSGGAFTVYPVVDGMPVWNQGTEVDCKSVTHHSLMDFAWDYAGNLYIAADEANGSAGDCVAIYATPYSGLKSTPAASRYAFTVSCQAGKQYTVTTICNPSEAGIINCSVGGNTRAAGVMTLESCTELTVTATPEVGYKFINWTDGNDNVLSTNNEFTFYVTEDITLKANFEYATYTGIVWKNLFYGGEANDIAAESAAYPHTNERLWRLMQVEYNNYCFKNSITQRNDRPDHISDNVVKACKGKKTQLNVTGFIGDITNAQNFFKNNEMFQWLREYMGLHSKNNLKGTTYKSPWIYYPYLFINRTDSAINWGTTTSGSYIGDLSNWAFNGTDCASTTYSNTATAWDSFITYGKPEYWRPYWAEKACNLPMTMKYSDYMPTISTWTRPDCPTGYITKNGTSTNIYPSDWYIWNIPANDPAIQDVDYKKYFILAWRKGSPTANEIVHHVYESNMELHASYVLKNIDENDRVDPNNHDASNDDVIKLMQNRHWVNLDPDPNVHPTHTLTVTRKLQAGMFNTICLPFGVDLTSLQDNNEYHHPLKDAEAYTYTGTTSTYNESGDPVVVLNFEKVTLLEAGKPYLIKMQRNTDLSEDMTFSTVSCFADLHPAQGGGLIFEPTINPTTVPAGSLILVADNRLALTTQEGTMAGMRGYFRIDESNPIMANDIMEQAAAGRVYLSMNKPTTTSIPVAPEAEQALQPKVRKVMYDGQIYILRGEEVYTITGHRVK